VTTVVVAAVATGEIADPGAGMHCKDPLVLWAGVPGTGMVPGQQISIDRDFISV